MQQNEVLILSGLSCPKLFRKKPDLYIWSSIFLPYAKQIFLEDVFVVVVVVFYPLQSLISWSVNQPIKGTLRSLWCSVCSKQGKKPKQAALSTYSIISSTRKQKTRTDTRGCSPSTLKFCAESGCIPESGDTKRDLNKKGNNKAQSQAIKLQPTDKLIKEKFLWGPNILLGTYRFVCIFIIRISTASYPLANSFYNISFCSFLTNNWQCQN